jgi:hypothetical protein
MHEQGSRPRARRKRLLKEMVGEELLIYDQDSHTAHCLSPIAASVWRHCDGGHDVTELTGLVDAGESMVIDALHELRGKDLLDAEPELMQDAVVGISRREAIGRVARYGAAAAAAPLIVSATAATPAMASSGTVSCKIVKGSSKTCCICTDQSCVTSTKNSEECTTFCGPGGFKQWTSESECTVVH